MVEGINARALVEMERINGMMYPGFFLLMIGIMIPSVLEELSDITGRITFRELYFLNGFFSLAMIIGIVMFAYGITYRRNGEIMLLLAFSLLLLFSVDAFLWIYFVILNWVPGPAGIFILPFAALGQIPLLLTLFFMAVVCIAHMTYVHDPRKLGKPRYH